MTIVPTECILCPDWDISKSKYNPHVVEIATRLGVRIAPYAQLKQGLYERLYFEFVKNHSAIKNWPEITTVVRKPHLQPVYDSVSSALRCSDSTPPYKHIYSIREGGDRTRILQNVDAFVDALTTELQDQFTVMDMDALTNATEQLCHVKTMVGIEGAGFVNQLFMPTNGTLVILHVPRNDKFHTDDPRQWHRSVSQYLGHRVLDIMIPSNYMPLNGTQWQRVVALLKNQTWSYALVDFRNVTMPQLH